MTVKKKKRARGSKLSFPIFVLFTVLLLFFSEEVKGGFISGLDLSALSIIPAIFPFFILSDLLLSGYTETNGVSTRIFEKTFHISSVALPTFIIGMLCGFPLGVKGAAELYKSEKITKKECEALSGFVNNPSLAFTVSGVGLGMLGSLKYGIILYFSVIFSSILTGIFYRPKELKTINSNENIEQTFNLSLSIKNAIYSSISVSAYIIFFSMLLSLASVIIKNDVVLAIFSPILEVGNATKLLSSTPASHQRITFALIAFALGFSGISVFMQAESYLPPEINRVKILVMKIIEGILSTIFAVVIFLITK